MSDFNRRWDKATESINEKEDIYKVIKKSSL